MPYIHKIWLGSCEKHCYTINFANFYPQYGSEDTLFNCIIQVRKKLGSRLHSMMGTVRSRYTTTSKWSHSENVSINKAANTYYCGVINFAQINMTITPSNFVMGPFLPSWLFSG